ncbi:MAG TPA: hypothetical protein VJM69_04590, partial [Dehalococcoidia bacterium]|nr:hypothetical protein [Dehalococcoidia bacterium]
TAPLILDMFRDPNFVFNTQYQFKERFRSQEGYFNVGDKRHRIGRSHIWETNFIPDVMTALLDDASHKVSGGSSISYEMAGNSLIGHIADWPAGRYHKAHYHAAGAVLLILRSTGYLLMWPKEVGTRPYQAGREDAVVEFHWKPGSVYSPPNGWFHMHLNTGREAARQLAFRTGSRKNPIGFHVAAKHHIDGTLMSLQEGGTIIEYDYEDPEIRRRYEEALRRDGIECRMPPVVYR